jgi:16S rRNA (uracil1498-N3)-methyltransferase
MIFLFDADAGKEQLHIKGENFKYLIKVRRHGVGDILGFRNQKSIDVLHRYKIVSIEPRSVELHLLESKELSVAPKKELHIGWCVIDSKSVEKVLASLNEIGVGKISFIYCDRSQKNFKADFKRYERILEASNQQCGRTAMMEFATYKTLQSFLDDYPDVKVFDFCDNVLACESDFRDLLIGCEGGFSEAERKLLAKQEVFRLDTPMVLRSESAALAVAAKILL